MMTREEIASIIIVSGGILGGMFFFDGDAFVRFLLEENKIAFRVFGIAFVALILITVIMYSRTMKVDIYDEMPTAATLKVIKGKYCNLVHFLG